MKRENLEEMAISVLFHVIFCCGNVMLERIVPGKQESSASGSGGLLVWQNMNKVPLVNMEIKFLRKVLLTKRAVSKSVDQDII